MTDAQKELLVLKGYIFDLPPADRQGIEQAAAQLREIVRLHNGHGKIALALLSAELAAEVGG